jgi:hypothetical protein
VTCFAAVAESAQGEECVMPLVYVMYALLVVACAAILFPHRGGRVDRVGAGGVRHLTGASR